MKNWPRMSSSTLERYSVLFLINVKSGFWTIKSRNFAAYAESANENTYMLLYFGRSLEKAWRSITSCERPTILRQRLGQIIRLKFFMHFIISPNNFIVHWLSFMTHSLHVFKSFILTEWTFVWCFGIYVAMK